MCFIGGLLEENPTYEIFIDRLVALVAALNLAYASRVQHCHRLYDNNIPDLIDGGKSPMPGKSIICIEKKTCISITKILKKKKGGGGLCYTSIDILDRWQLIYVYHVCRTPVVICNNTHLFLNS